MSDLFLRLVNGSINAGWLVLVILLLRLVLKRSPKWVRPALWGLVGLRLLLPVSIESPWSLLPSAETVPLAVGGDRAAGHRADGRTRDPQRSGGCERRS